MIGDRTGVSWRALRRTVWRRRAAKGQQRPKRGRHDAYQLWYGIQDLLRDTLQVDIQQRLYQRHDVGLIEIVYERSSRRRDVSDDTGGQDFDEYGTSKRFLASPLGLVFGCVGLHVGLFALDRFFGCLGELVFGSRQGADQRGGGAGIREHGCFERLVVKRQRVKTLTSGGDDGKR